MLRTLSVSLFVIVSASGAEAQTTWYVDVNAAPPGAGTQAQPYASIQFAIDQATTVAGDTLLVLPGTYAENVDYGGKALRIVAQTSQSATIDGGSAGPVVSARTGEGAGTELEGFVLRGGAGTPLAWPLPSEGGGSILVDGATLVVRDCTVHAEQSGVYADAATVLLDGTTVQDSHYRAVIGVASSLSLVDCVVQDNGGFDVLDGGGILLESGSLVLTRTRVSGNSTSDFGGAGDAGPAAGAGVLARPGTTVQVDDCDFLGNSAAYSNGGAYRGPGTIVNSRFTGNTAYNGGGLYGEDGLELRDCLIADNRGGIEEGGGRGGGVHSATLLRCEVRGNRLNGNGFGAGAYACSLDECVVAENEAVGYWCEGGGLNRCTAIDCTIEDNRVEVGDFFTPGTGIGGGAFESRLVGCEVRGNVVSYVSSVSDQGGYVAGGGLFLGSAEDCTFTGNRVEALEPVGGIGGGAAGLATLVRCTLRDNRVELGALPDPGGAQDIHGGGGALDSELTRCVLFGNSARRGGATSGGSLDHCSVVANVSESAGAAAVHAPDRVWNSIVWRNSGAQIGPPGRTVGYSLVQGGFAGSGNFDGDPAFWSLLVADLHLTSSSAAIDAGDPGSPTDPDGSPADVGAFPFDPLYCLTPGAYCDATPDSVGCVARIGHAGSPSLSGPDDFVVTASDVRSQSYGLLFFGPGADAVPFFGGTLCVAPPITRTPGAISGGSGSGGDCTGSLDFAFTHAFLAQSGLVAGDRVYCQFAYRDGGAVGLSDALEFVVCP